jgi:hypothetical protein
MVRFNATKTVFLIFLGMIMISGYASGASVPDLFFSGELQSGDVITDQLKSPDVWEINGIKGERVLIVLAVEEGQVPPEIYLFCPGMSQCEAYASLTFYNNYLVFDHVLAETGEYALLVRFYGEGEKIDYSLAVAKLSADGTYRIDPDSPDGNLIISDDIILEEYSDDFILGGALMIIAPYIVFPTIAVSSLHVLGEVVYDMVNILNVPGIKLYERIVHYDIRNDDWESLLVSHGHAGGKNSIN